MGEFTECESKKDGSCLILKLGWSAYCRAALKKRKVLNLK